MKSNEVIQAVCAAIKVGRPVMIWGPPGVGKSDVMRQVASILGMILIDIRALLLDPVDLRGIPSIVDGMTVWCPPGFLPKDDGKKYLIFLDELPAAPPLTQAGLYQLILDKKLGEYILPANCAIVCAGNRETDRAVSHRMPTAMLNRLVHIDFDVDPKPWAEWAIGNDIRFEVIAFIRLRPQLLHDFDPKKGEKAFPTPRSWAFVSDLLNASPPKKVLYEMIEGTIGKGAAAEFMGFLDIWQKLPDPDGVLMDPMNAEIPSQPSVMYALCGALARKAKEGNADRFFQYANRVPDEYSALMVMEARRKAPVIEKTKAFIEWSIKHEDALT